MSVDVMQSAKTNRR